MALSRLGGSQQDLRHNTEAKATATVVALQHSLLELANQPTVGQYYIREHVRQSMPAVIQTRNTLQELTVTAKHGSFAAGGGLDLAATLNSCMSPAALDRMQQTLAEAAAAAKSIQQQQQAAAAAAAGSWEGAGSSAAAAGRRVSGAAAAVFRRALSKRTEPPAA